MLPTSDLKKQQQQQWSGATRLIYIHLHLNTSRSSSRSDTLVLNLEDLNLHPAHLSPQILSIWTKHTYQTNICTKHVLHDNMITLQQQGWTPAEGWQEEVTQTSRLTETRRLAWACTCSRTWQQTHELSTSVSVFEAPSFCLSLSLS